MTKKPIIFPKIDASGESTFLMDRDQPVQYSSFQKAREKDWVRRAERYEANPGDLYAAWLWLDAHPIFYYYASEERRHETTLCDDRGVAEGLGVEPAMVDKVTRKTGGDPANQELEIWIEVFPASLTFGSSAPRLHDVELDTGAPTYEEAVIKVAKLIYDRHGHDRVRLTEMWEET